MEIVLGLSPRGCSDGDQGKDKPLPYEFKTGFPIMMWQGEWMSIFESIF